MSAAARRTLPARADLDQQRKLAKELLADFRRGDADANARIRAALPDLPSDSPRLAGHSDPPGTRASTIPTLA